MIANCILLPLFLQEHNMVVESTKLQLKPLTSNKESKKYVKDGFLPSLSAF